MTLEVKAHERLYSSLKQLGFAIFQGDGFCSYENKTLWNGGIRIEVVDDVSSVWCPKLSFFDVIATNEVVGVVSTLLSKNHQP